MGRTEKIDLMIEGGNAKPDATISMKLGPLKINIGDVMKRINDKTASFKGMKLPVKLEVNVETKDVNIELGTPPVSELIKNELKLEKGSGTPNMEKIHNIGIETLIKISKMKIDGMLVNNLKNAVKTIAGSCNSLGILIEGKLSSEFNKELEAGKYDRELREEIIEVSAEKEAILKKELVVVNERIKKEIERLKAAAEKAKEAAPAAEAAPKTEGAEAKAEEGAAKTAAPAKGKEAAAPAKAEEKKPAGKEDKKK